MVKTGTTIKLDRVPKALEALRYLDQNRVMVGIPSTKAPRDDPDGGESPINNAAIGFILDRGDPGQNLPARPWLRPGVATVHEDTTSRLKAAGNAVLSGDRDKAEKQYNAIGLTAVSAVKNYLQTGPFAPLSPRTIAQRVYQRGLKPKGGWNKRAGEQKYLDLVKGGMDPAQAQEAAGIKPLINTAQMLNAVSYVIRKVKKLF